MATVYLAIQESLEREVVLKCMDSERDGGSDFINRFLNEGRIIASLQHPHIITVHDIGTVHDMVWIAMEYVQGGDLKARLERSIEPIEALELVANIAQALGYGHQHGIVHRDVKPANILFREDGTALLTDFGIAKQVSQDNELTSTGTILGSPYYMSPEQAEGLQVDGRTDIYSLGVILYEMLTGERPYVGDAAVKVIMQHIQSPIPKVPESVRRFQPLINMMMAKNRDQRIATTDALVAEIRKLTGTVDTEEGESQTAPSRVQSIQQQPWTPRKRLTTLLACTSLIMVALGIFYAYAMALQRAAVVRVRDADRTANVTQLSVPQTSPPPAPNTPGNVTNAQVIHALEMLANNSLRDDRLTQPVADNAYYYFSRLLALDPDNNAARKGFADIAERFVVLAEQEFSNNNDTKAQSYIALGLQVDPKNKGLNDLRGFIENKDESLIDTFLGLFRSGKS